MRHVSGEASGGSGIKSRGTRVVVVVRSVVDVELAFEFAVTNVSGTESEVFNSDVPHEEITSATSAANPPCSIC